MELANSQQNTPVYEFGRFRLETRSGLLYFGEIFSRLPPKIYQCLIVLLENSGGVVTKDDLTDRIWPDTFVDDNALTYTVSQLRKSLREFDSEKEHIETVPRVGYRFSSPVLVTYDDGDVRERPIGRRAGERSIEAITVEETYSEEIEIVDPISSQRQLPERTTTRLIAPFLATIGIFGVLLTIGTVYVVRNSQSTSSVRRIAVLPLAALGNQTLDETLTIGMTDALITQLGRSSQLNVRPLSSSSRVISEIKDPIEAGKALNVDYVVDWHYQIVDQRIRVNAKLLSVKDGDQVWSEVFDGDYTRLFSIQDAISLKIATSLIKNLNFGEEPFIRSMNDRNPDAYQAYLRGRYHWNTRTKTGLLTARNFFEQAVALDAKFADAYIGLADAYVGLYDYGHLPAKETIPKSNAAIFKAIQLNPTHSKAYSTLASIEFLHNNNWESTEANFHKAIELSPNDPTPRLRYGWMLSVVGRLDEGLAHLVAAEALDPTSEVIQANIVENLIFKGRIEEAQERLDRLKAGGSQFSLIYWHQGTIYFTQDRLDEAISEYVHAFELDEGSTEISNAVRIALKNDGRSAAYRVWRSELERRYSVEYFPPSIIALVGAMEKDIDGTVKWLQEAKRVRDPWILQIFEGPEFRFLDDNQDFQNIIRELKMKV